MNEFDPQNYWDRRFSSSVSLETTGFIGMGKAFNRALYRGYERALRLLLRRTNLQIGTATTVIDAGAGSGFLEVFCDKQSVRNVTGLDFVQAAVESLRTRFPSYTFFQHDLTKPLTQSVSPADFVFCISVLYHIVSEEGFQQAIKTLAQLARPGGYLVIADNFLPQPLPHDKRSHQRHWTRAEYESALQKNGYQIVRYQPIFFLLNAPLRMQFSPLGRGFLRFWLSIQKWIAGNEFRGSLYGFIAYGVDSIAQLIFPWGPSNHYLLCKKAD